MKSPLILEDGSVIVVKSGSGECGCHTAVVIPGNAYGAHKLGNAASMLSTSK